MKTLRKLSAKQIETILSINKVCDINQKNKLPRMAFIGGYDKRTLNSLVKRGLIEIQAVNIDGNEGDAIFFTEHGLECLPKAAPAPKQETQKVEPKPIEPQKDGMEYVIGWAEMANKLFCTIEEVKESVQKGQIPSPIDKNENGAPMWNKAPLQRLFKMAKLIKNEKKKLNNTRYHRNYRRLDSLIGGITIERLREVEDEYINIKLNADYMMPLTVEIREIDEHNNTAIIGMGHHYIQCGDVMYDPYMEISLNLKTKTADALMYEQTALQARIVSYPKPGFVNPRAKKSNNSFLEDWLKNAKSQGYYK